MKKTYKVLSNLRHNGNVYKAGDEVELDTKVGNPLMDDGVLADPKAKAAEDEVPLTPRAPRGATAPKANDKKEEVKDEKKEDETKTDADKKDDGKNADDTKKSEDDEDDADDL